MIDKWESKAAELDEAKNYHAAAEYYEKLKNYCGLSSYGYCRLSFCYYFTSRKELCLRLAEECLDNEEMLEEIHLQYIYYNAGLYLDDEKKDYLNSRKWYIKALAKAEVCGNNFVIAENYWRIAWGYCNLKDYYNSLSYYDKAIIYQCKELKIKTDGVKSDYFLAAYYREKAYTILQKYQKVTTEVEKYYLKAFSCGDKDARNRLEEAKRIYN